VKHTDKENPWRRGESRAVKKIGARNIENQAAPCLTWEFNPEQAVFQRQNLRRNGLGLTNRRTNWPETEAEHEAT
jgi:hypothetical protein